MKNRTHIRFFLGILCSIVLFSCSPRKIREAQSIVAQADSLREEGKMYGIDDGDSATLAQTYEIVDAIPLPFRKGMGLSRTYSHACYHYGRLLREKDNPVAAMECFINATHSHTRDYHILGRVYSHMGSICHLAGDFPLSYDMYEKSANMFLRNGDTINYYYALNDMAYELAEQGKKEKTLKLLEEIENQCTHLEVLIKTYETKAELYLRVEQYDSALLYTKKSNEVTGLLIRAQAYSFIGNKDSAVHYANHALSFSHDLFTLNSALYILTQDDDSKGKEEIREVSANRSDIQKLIEIRRAKLSQATQLLQQDLAQKCNLSWLYAIIATLFVGGAGISIYVYRKRTHLQLLSQKIENMESKNMEIQKKRQIQIEERIAIIATSTNIATTLCWKDFDQMCVVVDQQFNMLASQLRHRQVLTEKEIRLCVLVVLGLTRTQIADILPYAQNSVGKLKDHTAKSLGTTGKNLREYLLNMVIAKSVV